MITFSDLLKNNVAPSPYKFDVITSSSDRFLINYNNIWGVISDTRMSIGEDGNYYITGSLIKNKEKCEQFVYACSWGNYMFKDSSIAVNSLYDYCIKNRKTIQHDIVNGDDVLVIKEFTEEQNKWAEEYMPNCYSLTPCQCSDVSKKEQEIAATFNFKY